jgi:hypothetical protein
MSIAAHARAGLILGRVSNLPTVWSNLLAGWFLGGGGADVARLGQLFAGGSLLYVGGMYLNDYCDAEFDRRYRAERPIPSGAISRRAVGNAALLWLALGLGLLVPLGWVTAATALLLTACIILYDLLHKQISWAPVLMAFCRFLLYPLAASAVAGAVPLHVLLAATALGAYVAGITYLARGESRPEKSNRWALLLLLAPLALAWASNLSQPSLPSLMAMPLFLFWMAWLLIPLVRRTNPSIGRVVAGLLAGIVLVDVLAVAPLLGTRAAWFLVLFGLALLLQRVIPAT